MLIDTWHPVTDDLGLIQAPLDDVVDALLAWHKSIGIRYGKRTIDNSLAEAFGALLPLSNAKQRRLFIRTVADWTACFQNGIQGSDPMPAMSYLAGTMDVVAIRVCATPSDAKWPATVWEVYASKALGGEPPLNYKRSIAVLNDGGRWTFEESGTPYDFERVELYRQRRVRDRFPREVLAEYLSHFGLRPFEDAFYRVGPSSPAVLLNQAEPVVSLPEFSLEEVIAGEPWAKR